MAPNTEFLIETVQKYTVLYDTTHRDYKNIKIKNKIWDNISEILGDCDGDTLKKQWKNLRDAYSKYLRACRTPGQASKLTERYRTWPWANFMGFLRPHLEFAETLHSNIQRNAEESGSQSTPQRNAKESIDTAQRNAKESINVAQLQPFDLPQPQQDDTPQLLPSRRKRTFDYSQSQVDKLINFVSKNTEKDDDTDLLFKSYAKKLKKMTNRRQASVKFEIAKIMFQAEIDEVEEMQSRSDVEDKKYDRVEDF